MLIRIFFLTVTCFVVFNTSLQARQLTTNGFLTVGAAQSDAEASMFGIKDELNFSALSLVGMQTSYQPAENRLRFVAQLLARGANSWELEAEWAYANYKITDNTQAFLGRIRVPFYMISEQYDVGFAYPWIRPPDELYGFLNIPFTSLDGLSVKHQGTIFSLDYASQLYGGKNNAIGLDVAGISIPDTGSIEIYGVTFKVGSELFSIRAGHHEGKNIVLDIIQPIIDAFESVGLPVTAAVLAQDPANILPVDNGKANFSSIGFTSNVGNLFLMGEWGERKIKQQLPFPTTENWFFTAGYSFGKFVPHITFGEYSVDDKTLFNQDQESITLGFRFNATSSTAVKFEVADIEIDSAANAIGLYDSLPPNFNGVPLNITSLDQELTMVRFSVNTIF